MNESQHDELLRARIENVNEQYPLEDKTFTAAVTDRDSPTGVRLSREDRPYVFVKERKPG